MIATPQPSCHMQEEEGISANFLKDKFLVVVCDILTVYFVGSMFTVCSSFGFVSKFILFGEFLSVLSYQVSLRPTRLPVYVHDHVYLYFLFIAISFYFHHFSLHPPSIPPNYALCFMS